MIIACRRYPWHILATHPGWTCLQVHINTGSVENVLQTRNRRTCQRQRYRNEATMWVDYDLPLSANPDELSRQRGQSRHTGHSTSTGGDFTTIHNPFQFSSHTTTKVRTSHRCGKSNGGSMLVMWPTHMPRSSSVSAARFHCRATVCKANSYLPFDRIGSASTRYAVFRSIILIGTPVRYAYSAR
jgi:hypothetical protein